MPVVDVSEIARLGSLRLLAARVRLALRALGEGEDIASTQYALDKACDFFRSLSEGQENLRNLRVGLNTGSLISRYGIARRAWMAGQQDAPSQEELEAVVGPLARHCKALAQGEGAPSACVEPVRRFFDALFQYTGSELERRAQHTPEHAPRLETTA